MVHSGLQPAGDVGSPIIPATQVQMACLLALIWQLVFLPHGDGEQGSVGDDGGKQPWNGFPVYPALHWQSSPISVMMQSALIPHGPGSQKTAPTGSCLGSQPSSLAFPGRKPGLHWHVTVPSGCSMHSVLGPHGLGLQPESSTVKHEITFKGHS